MKIINVDTIPKQVNITLELTLDELEKIACSLRETCNCPDSKILCDNFYDLIKNLDLD